MQRFLTRVAPSRALLAAYCCCHVITMSLCVRGCFLQYVSLMYEALHVEENSRAPWPCSAGVDTVVRMHARTRLLTRVTPSLASGYRSIDLYGNQLQAVPAGLFDHNTALT